MYTQQNSSNGSPYNAAVTPGGNQWWQCKIVVKSGHQILKFLHFIWWAVPCYEGPKYILCRFVACSFYLHEWLHVPLFKTETSQELCFPPPSRFLKIVSISCSSPLCPLKKILGQGHFHITIMSNCLNCFGCESIEAQRSVPSAM